MKKPIICFEGPSGIGKSTMGQLLSDKYNIVPEVNLLFEKPKNASKFWYHEKQLERYFMARKASKGAILDGDVFQPIWYNWVCDYPSEFLSKEETHSFYKSSISAGKIAFPDLYIIFYVDESELWIRKEKDKTRRRRNFEKHLKIIEPLKSYYRFLDRETDIEMKFIHYLDFEQTRREVQVAINKINFKEVDEMKAFEQIEKWLSETKKS